MSIHARLVPSPLNLSPLLGHMDGRDHDTRHPSMHSLFMCWKDLVKLQSHSPFKFTVRACSCGLDRNLCIKKMTLPSCTFAISSKCVLGSSKLIVVRANGPMMLTKWAEAIKQKEVVPVAASRNLRKEQMNQALGTSIPSSGKTTRKQARKSKISRKQQQQPMPDMLSTDTWGVNEESMAGADALAFLKKRWSVQPRSWR